MSDDAPPAGVDEAPIRSVRGRRKWPWLVLASVLLVPALVFAAWSAVALNYAYSEGDRVGYVLKLSQKGWICKTWEGELSMTTVPGVAPERWAFTVRDDEVAKRIRDLQGQQVALDYEQRKGLPTSCFGETSYHVQNVRTLGAPAGTPVPPATVTPAPAPAPTTTRPAPPAAP